MFLLYKNIKDYSKLHHEIGRSKESHKRLHPWLAGAQYRTTAVVLVYRLISLIGPHCPASTYSSTCPFLSMHFVVHGREKEGSAVGMRKERDKLRACVCTDGRGCSAIGALFAKYLPGYHKHNTVPQKFVRRPVSFI